jgi:hypothetical protein
MYVIYKRFTVRDAAVEKEISIQTLQAREMAKLSHKGNWDRYSISRAANMLPVTFIHRGHVNPILFSKTIHILAHTPNRTQTSPEYTHPSVDQSVTVTVPLDANLTDIQTRWLAKVKENTID